MSNIRLSSFSTFGLRKCWICRAGVTTWVTFSLTLMRWVLLRVRDEFYFDSTIQIRLISFRSSHDSNPRMGTDFTSTTRKDTLNSLLLCSRVSEHLLITRISKHRVSNSQGRDQGVDWVSGRFWKKLRCIMRQYQFYTELEVRWRWE